MTWQGDIYTQRCVEKPDYRIITTYSKDGESNTIFHGRKVIGHSNNFDKAKQKAEEHANG